MVSGPALVSCDMKRAQKLATGADNIDANRSAALEDAPVIPAGGSRDFRAETKPQARDAEL